MPMAHNSRVLVWGEGTYPWGSTRILTPLFSGICLAGSIWLLRSVQSLWVTDNDQC